MVSDARIGLTEEERLLFAALLEAAKKDDGTTTTLRCAGGWVRDKLLGRESDDVDIALDDCTGAAFAERVNERLAATGSQTRTVAVIAANPEQSKHLETARMKVHGHWVDLVNLRSEEYAEGSRIPVASFGTPLEDALRRDFTINSLFYNLNDGRVEDLTGHGLEDLRAGVIRTPMPPEQTFLDDPLRALRAVRFAARFGFSLEPAVEQAARSEEVQTALARKVSRERVGAEMAGMLGGPDPVGALRLIERLGLLHVALESPGGETAEPGFAAGALARAEAVDAAAQAADLGLSADARRLALVAATLYPLRLATVREGKGRPAPLSAAVVRGALKWKAKEGDTVVAIQAAATELDALAREGVGGGDAEEAGGSPRAFRAAFSAGPGRVRLARVLRDAKEFWRAAAAVSVVAPHAGAGPGPEAGGTASARSDGLAPAAHPSDPPTGSPTRDPTEHAEKRARSRAPETPARRGAARVEVLLEAVRASGLDGCWTWKPAINGKRAGELSGVKGVELGAVMAALAERELAHPGADGAELERWLVEDSRWARK